MNKAGQLNRAWLLFIRKARIKVHGQGAIGSIGTQGRTNGGRS